LERIGESSQGFFALPKGFRWSFEGVPRSFERFRECVECFPWSPETARLLSVLLPVTDREPLFQVEEAAAAEGFPLVAGWLDRYEPR
jgi:hypothetical protein